MRGLRVGLAMLLLVSALAPIANAAPFNLANDWSLTNDGSNGWLYGSYTSGLNPSTFVPFGIYDTALVTGMGFWRTSSDIDPNIEKNLGATPLSPCCGLTFAPGEVAFGPYFGPAVARWTAPTAGLYDISAAFRTIQTENLSPNAYVYEGSTLLFSQLTTAGGISYAGTVNMLAGDTIDFVVWGNDTMNKTTEVKATISAVPEPASMLLLGTGLAGLASRRWLRRRR